MPTEPVRVGIIGVGVMGAEHARLLSSIVAGSEVIAVHDVQDERAAATAGSTGALAFDDPLALIRDASVDAVLIASADATHEEFVLAAVAAGKPVLCEKPLAPDIEGCRRIVAAELAAARRLIGVGFMRRFDPGYVAMRDVVVSGALGRPLVVHCVHRNAAAPGMSAEGRVTSSAVHEFDVCRWLLGAELVEVVAHDVVAHDDAEQNPLVLTLRADDGSVVDIEIFVGARYGYDVRCELVCETGTLVLDAPTATVRRVSGATSVDVAHDWTDRFEHAYRSELQHWVDAVRADAVAPTASAWDGYVATVVAHAAIGALHSGQRTSIELEPRPELYA